jgi:hypothetical protein
MRRLAWTILTMCSRSKGFSTTSYALIIRASSGQPAIMRLVARMKLVFLRLWVHW